MKYQYDVTQTDRAILRSLASKTSREKVHKALELRVLLYALVISGVVALAEIISFSGKYGDGRIGTDFNWVVWSILAFFVINLAYTRVFQKRYIEWEESEMAPFPIHQELQVTPDGLQIDSRFGRTLYLWSSIRSVTSLADYVAFVTATASIVIIPLRAFPTLEDRQSFEAELRSHLDGR